VTDCLRSLCLLLAFVIVGGCRHAAVSGGVRFANRPPVWAVDDRQDTPKPKTIDWYPSADPFHYSVTRPITHKMDFRTPKRAANINSVGGVPDSTWFVNRIGRGDLSPRDIARGPGTHPRPDDGPLRVVGGKPAGVAPGLLVEDSNGERFIVKFDFPARPELDTGADVVVQRLLWAVGYHVPQDEIVLLEREQLVVDPDGKWRDKLGRKHPITDDYIDGQLAKVLRSPDGTYRGLTSKFLPGEPVGGYGQEGVREGDPNDVVQHEERRDLRGQFVFFGWLGHTDLKRENSLDMWVEDPRDPTRHFLVHYILDFGKALGASMNPADGLSANFDWRYALPSLLSLGLVGRPWEGYTIDHGLRGIGYVDGEHFRPELFRPRTPYMPFARFDAYDGLWATDILLRLTPAHIRAAVDQARFDDLRSTEYLTRVIVERQRIAARHFLHDVAPIARFSVTERDGGATVCGINLWVAHELDRDIEFVHSLDAFDRHGVPLKMRRTVEPGPDGSVCLDGIEPPVRAEGYVIVGMHVLRDREWLPSVWVHLARDPRSGKLRIIGVHRE
jgi:hypothetical protein